MKADWIGSGRIRVTDDDGRQLTVYVAGGPGDRWAFSQGQVFRERAVEPTAVAAVTRRSGAVQAVTAPMPATVLKVLVTAGQHVAKGATLVIVEAMKMELPLRAPREATVAAVKCREGELVAPDAVLVEFTPGGEP